MGTRYIWKKSELEEEYFLESMQDTSILLGLESSSWYVIALESRPEMNTSTGTFRYSGYAKLCPTSGGVDSGDYPYACPLSYNPFSSGGSTSSSGYVTINRMYEYCGTTNTSAYWRKYVTSGNQYLILSSSSTSSSTLTFTYYMGFDTEVSPGAFVGYVSSASSSAYPNYADSGDFFYEAIENDEIDPIFVSIPQTIISGDSITSSVTESSDAISSEYGTITYLFSHKYDNESWSTNQTDQNLSYTFQIATGKSQVTVRAYATDGLGYTSASPTQSQTRNIIASHPPTAPGSISINRTINGWATTIKITAAADTDGTIVNYKYYCAYKSKNTGAIWPEIDESQLVTIATINALETNYVISTSVPDDEIIFLASAVDDSGMEGPKIQSNVYDIQSDTITLLGPADKDFGNKMASFNVAFSAIVAGDIIDKTLALEVKNDDTVLYNSVIDSNQLVNVRVDIKNLLSGSHVITATASKEGYDSVMAQYVYRIEDLVMPENANIVQFQDHTGKAIFAEADARSVFMSNGNILEDVIESLMSRLDVLEGGKNG